MAPLRGTQGSRLGWSTRTTCTCPSQVPTRHRLVLMQVADALQWRLLDLCQHFRSSYSTSHSESSFCARAVVIQAPRTVDPKGRSYNRLITAINQPSLSSEAAACAY